MNKLPDSELVLVPGETLLTDTPEEGRLEYSKDPDSSNCGKPSSRN